MVLIPRKRKSSRIAIARPAPSWGSVPAPNSSRRIKEAVSTWFKIDTILVIWLEKVDKLCSIDCSSPISAKTCEKMPTRLPGSARMGRPDWAIICASPSVFSMMVFPPVLGPVITISVKSSVKCRSFATAFSIKGWRSCKSWMERLLLTSGTTALQSRIKRYLALIKSKWPIIQALLAISAAWGRRLSDNSSRIWMISYRSSARWLAISSLRLTTARGSI